MCNLSKIRTCLQDYFKVWHLHKIQVCQCNASSDWRHLLPACIGVPFPVVIPRIVPRCWFAPCASSALLLPPSLTKTKVVQALVKRYIQVGGIHPHAVDLHVRIQSNFDSRKWMLIWVKLSVKNARRNLHHRKRMMYSENWSEAWWKNPTCIMRTRMKMRMRVQTGLDCPLRAGAACRI